MIAENEGDDFADPASQSVAADERFVAATGREPGTGLVLLVRAGAPVDGPEGGRKVAAVVAAVAAEEGVAQVVTYAGTRDRGLVSRDGRSTYLPVVLSGDADGAGVYEELQERFEGRDDVLVGKSRCSAATRRSTCSSIATSTSSRSTRTDRGTP